MKQSKERSIAVGSVSQNRSSNRYVEVPALKLTGKWLQESGFKYGSQVKIKVEKNKLTITLVK
jgi:toxic protein SymE